VGCGCKSLKKHKAAGKASQDGPQDYEEPGKGGPWTGEPRGHPATASDPGHPRNEEGEVPKANEQAEGQSASSGPVFSDEKIFTVNVAVNAATAST
jgi:hypothetical protein